MGKEYAESILKEVLTEKKTHNLLSRDEFQIISDEKILLEVIEPILFKHYPKSVIEDQKPYEIYDFEQYFVVNGTLPMGIRGGTFEIIVRKKDAKILKLSHSR
ncbi:NTF2 fold immunity protein [Capnocytophaga cynodegmi]|uniref:NTF2 fold immunity protein n=1 Tax=Capnocytophaga cynodegmi TaxID=28189 RepID=UPI00385EE8C1